MSAARNAKGFTPLLDLGPIAAAVTRAVKSAPRTKGRKRSLVVRATKQQRAEFDARYAAAYVHVKYHIQPVFDAYEIWCVDSGDVLAVFPSFGKAQQFVEGLE